jgi:hypothetical protein
MKSKINSLESCLFFVYKSHDQMRIAIKFAEHDPHIDKVCLEKLNDAFNAIQVHCANLIIAKNKAEREYLNLIKRGVK